MEGLGCVEALVLVVVVTVNGMGLWGWSEVLSVWSLRIIFEGRHGCRFIPLP